MKEKMKPVLYTLAGIGIFILIIVVIALLLKGGLWISEKAFIWLPDILLITLLLNIFIILPLSIIRKTRPVGSVLMYIISYVYGFIAWVWSFLITYVTWGFIAIIIGICIAGVGVVPIAIIAAIISNHWETILELVILIVCCFGTRALGTYLAEKCEA